MTPTVEEIEARPTGCPRCGSGDVCEIIYGLLDAAPFAGEAVAFGGCHVTTGESPAWRCGTCWLGWGLVSPA